MKAKYFGIPTLILGGIVALWLYMRKGVASVPAQFQPSPASSGIPVWSDQAQQYNTQPTQASPSQTTATQLANTLNPQPALDAIRAAQPAVFGNDNAATGSHLTANVPAKGNLSMMSRADMAARSGAAENHGACGCGSAGSCKTTCPDNNAQFTDGQGVGCMSVSRRRQIDKLETRYPGLWEKFSDQLQNSGYNHSDVRRLMYVARKGDASSGAPELEGDKTLPAAPGEWIHPMIYRQTS